MRSWFLITRRPFRMFSSVPEENMLDFPVQRGKIKRGLYRSKSGTLENIRNGRLVIRNQEHMAFHFRFFRLDQRRSRACGK